MWDFREAFLEWVLRWPRPKPKHPRQDDARPLPPQSEDFPEGDSRNERDKANG